MPLQELTLSQVIEAALAYYAAGKLIAQHPETSQRLTYRNGEYRCAVGAALSEDTIRAIEERGLHDGAVTEGFVLVKSRAELSQILRIQYAHDMWAKYGGAIKERAFLRTLKPTKRRKSKNV